MKNKKSADTLEQLLKVACYEREFLQARLDLIRLRKDQLVFLLDTPTLQERLEAGKEMFKELS